MRYEDGSALLEGIGVDVCQPMAIFPSPGSPAPITGTTAPRARAIRQDGVAAGRVALECCRNGMPTGAAVRSIATAFGLPGAVVAMHLGRARRKKRCFSRKFRA